jgi:hypothetical protein
MSAVDTSSQASVATAATAAATPGSANPVTVPRIMVKPNLKAAASKTTYSVALDNMMNKFCASYLGEGMTPEQQQQTLAELKDTQSMIRDLCDEFLRPICEGKPQAGGAAVSAAVPALGGHGLGAAVKPLSDWQIFLKYAKDLVPGHKDSTDKMGLCKAHYAAMTEQECADLRAQYEAENPSAVAALAQQAATAATAGGAKGKRQTGFTVFAKDWYAAFKAANPDASGLQSSLCSQAWKDLSEAEREQWKAAAKQ